MPIYYTKDWESNRDINYYDEVVVCLEDGSKYIYMVPSETVDMDIASDTIEGIMEYLSRYLDTEKVTNLFIDDEEILVEELQYLKDGNIEEDGTVADLGPAPVGKAADYPDYEEIKPDEDAIIDTDFLNNPDKVLMSTLQLVENEELLEERKRRGYYTYKIRNGKKVKFFIPKIPIKKRKGYKRVWDKKAGRYKYERITASAIMSRRRAARKASTKRKRMLSLRKRKSLISSNRRISGVK